MYVTSSFKAIAITAMLATSLIFTGCGESDPAETDNTNETGSETGS